MNKTMKTTITSVVAYVILLTIVMSALFNVGIISLVMILAVFSLFVYVLYMGINPFTRMNGGYARYTFIRGLHYPIQSMATWLFPWCRFIKAKTVYISGYVSPTAVKSIEGTDCLHKLFGVSFGLRVHKNSIRLAWRAEDEGEYSLWLYGYNNGERVEQWIGDVFPNKKVFLYVNTKTMTVSVMFERADGESTYSVSYPLLNFCNPKGRKFLLLPYFGGEVLPPYSSSVFIKAST